MSTEWGGVISYRFFHGFRQVSFTVTLLGVGGVRDNPFNVFQFQLGKEVFSQKIIFETHCFREWYWKSLEHDQHPVLFSLLTSYRFLLSFSLSSVDSSQNDYVTPTFIHLCTDHCFRILDGVKQQVLSVVHSLSSLAE
jgi:hypothetical protein